MRVASTKVCDDKLLASTLDAIVVKRPKPTKDALQHLCLDKGYGNGPTREVVGKRYYIARICRIGEEMLPRPLDGPRGATALFSLLGFVGVVFVSS